MHSPIPQPIPADMLLLAYRQGIFPMADSRDDPEVFWVEPRERATIPLDGLHVSRSLKKALKQDRFTVTVNQDFAAVMDACAAPRPGHPDSWISARIEASYRQLHALGSAHSVECWDGDAGSGRLVGGLYGVSFDRVFCGESMFSHADNASKVALAYLVALMRRGGYALLDCQFMTDHLASLGAVEMPQADYLKLVEKAGGKPNADLMESYKALKAQALAQVQTQEGSSFLSAEAVSASPGKLIAQSFTQTS